MALDSIYSWLYVYIASAHTAINIYSTVGLLPFSAFPTNLMFSGVYRGGGALGNGPPFGLKIFERPREQSLLQKKGIFHSLISLVIAYTEI